METKDSWEYRVYTFGSIWRGARDEDIEAILNQWGAEGWEVIDFAEVSSKVKVVAKRRLGQNIRRRRSMPGWD
ncbi:MAG TPA: DUF4177 domain-containing protein [Anaerolineales bacterium]|nr:DUF4177 domain-containing protein [Anaerolineales bacterium]